MQTHRSIDFDRFYRERANAVYLYFLRRVGAEAAQDLTADVFVVAWRRWGAVPEGEASMAWLYGVARNVLMDRRRSMGRRVRLAEKVNAQPEPLVAGPEAQVVRSAEYEAVLAALMRLPEKDREIILLVGWEGLSREQVAEMMSVTRSAIDKRIARAYKRMARHLGVGERATSTVRISAEEGGEA